jgi:enamine deaminase RidA (YjgF/YER057c/UK114 family)
MSNDNLLEDRMKDTHWIDDQDDETARRDAVYDDAIRSIAQARTRRAAAGHAWMAAAMGYGAGSTGTGLFGRISHIAKLFCIGFAFLAPSLLLVHVAF